MNESLHDHVWRGPDGQIIACVEKLKVLRENLEELQEACQDALDDAVLMGCEESQFRQVLLGLVSRLKSEYKSGADAAGTNAAGT
jgi:hypothetical protein